MEEQNTSEKDFSLLNANQDLKEFDWSTVETGSENQTDLTELEPLYQEDFVTSTEKKLTSGTIVSMDERETVVDINGKAQGVIPSNEFRYNPEFKVGDVVEVFILKQEDKIGQLVLSHKRAKTLKAWERVNRLHETQEIIEGVIECRTKGGMIVNIFGIETFLPGSQIDVKPIRDYDQYVGKTMEFKVVKINKEFKNVVVSHKALIEADMEEQKKEIISGLEKGQILEGVVKNITSYGVFIDLGGVDGLAHITDLSWNRISHPSEVVELDQKVNVVILDFDEAKSRIQLGLKQLSAHPWDALDENLKVGDKTSGKVVVMTEYGAFVEIAPGIEGLVHVSEMSWSTHMRTAQDFLNIGDTVDTEILTLDREEKRMSLGIKQLTPDPWLDLLVKYPLQSKHFGTVRNFTNFGIFVELEEGIDGLIHISDLSWTKKVKHPSEFINVGDKIEVMILEADLENRKLSLGHKQTLDNPWDVFEEEYTVDSTHQGTVFEIINKGALIKFASHQEIEGFVPQRFLVKEDGGNLQQGDSADFKVIEFNKDLKRIVLSHVATYKEEDKTTAETTSTSSSKNTEKSTLGDLDALVELKAKINKKSE